MIQHEGTFTDAHGITHTNPVFVVRHAWSNSSDSSSVSYDFQNGEYSSSDSKYLEYRYEISFWPSAEAKEQGRMPLIHYFADGEQSTAFSPSSLSNLLESCEAHFAANFL